MLKDVVRNPKSALMFFLLTCGVSMVAHAERPWWFNPVVTGTGGVIWANVAESQSFVVDSSTYHFSPNTLDENETSAQGIWGGFIGTEIPIRQYLALDIGLGYYQPGENFKVKGRLTQGPDSESIDKFKYGYKVIIRQLLGEAKLLWMASRCWHPYFSFGLGASFNESYDYFVTNPMFITFSPDDTSHSNTSFSYNLGVGVDVDLAKQWRFGVGYRFSDFGKTSLGSGHIDTVPTPQTLSKSNIYANELIAQLTFVLA